MAEASAGKRHAKDYADALHEVLGRIERVCVDTHEKLKHAASDPAALFPSLEGLGEAEKTAFRTEFHAILRTVFSVINQQLGSEIVNAAAALGTAEGRLEALMRVATTLRETRPQKVDPSK